MEGRAVYDAEAIKSELSRRLMDPPRGTKARLARAAGVTAATVTKWAQGQICPTPDHWPAIEEALSLPPRHLAEIGGVAGLRWAMVGQGSVGQLVLARMEHAFREHLDPDSQSIAIEIVRDVMNSVTADESTPDVVPSIMHRRRRRSTAATVRDTELGEAADADTPTGEEAIRPATGPSPAPNE